MFRDLFFITHPHRLHSAHSELFSPNSHYLSHIYNLYQNNAHSFKRCSNIKELPPFTDIYYSALLKPFLHSPICPHNKLYLIYHCSPHFIGYSIILRHSFHCFLSLFLLSKLLTALIHEAHICSPIPKFYLHPSHT